MSLSEILDAISGETGAVASLVVFVFFFIRGYIVPKSYIEDLKESNKNMTISNEELRGTVASQAKAFETLSKTLDEGLETSRTILKVLEGARKATGVMGEDIYNDSSSKER